mgnify:CR=1 FL=1|jgi:hypothetical protein
MKEPSNLVNKDIIMMVPYFMNNDDFDKDRTYFHNNLT